MYSKTILIGLGMFLFACLMDLKPLGNTPTTDPTNEFANLPRPWFNRTIVELCYYSQDKWDIPPFQDCQMFKWDLKEGTPEEWILKLPADMFKEYVRTEPYDRNILVECYLKKSSPNCASLISGDEISIRYNRAKEYFDQLAEFERVMYECHKNKNNHLLNNDCDILLEYEQIEHCWRFHKYYHYQQCDRLFLYSVVPPTDKRSYFIYTTWRGINEEFEGYLATLAKTNPTKATMERCLYLDNWLENPEHECQHVVVPNDDNPNEIEKLFQEQERKDRIFDCKNYHSDDNHENCFWYDQTARRIVDLWAKSKQSN